MVFTLHLFPALVDRFASYARQRFTCLLLFTCMLTVSHFSQAQNSAVSGKVLVKDGATPVAGAHVRLIDSLSVDVRIAVTDSLGAFLFNGLGDRINYSGQVTSVGYDTVIFKVFTRDRNIQLADLHLQSSVQMLKEVVVEDDSPVRQDGDTIVYNAKAYKTAPDATAGDLVKKLPGVVASEDGTIKAQGKEVQRILIDGEEFFGKNVDLALKNLPADIIRNVRIFDDQSDQTKLTGFNDGNIVRTINFVTSRGVKEGKFGKLEGGYGADERYVADVSLNYFKTGQQLSVLGGANNFNRTQNPQGGGAAAGISTINHGGINFVRNSRKFVTLGNYVFNGMETDNLMDIQRLYFLPFADDLEYLENNDTKNTAHNHIVMARMEYRPDFRNSLILSPRVNANGRQSSGLQNIRNMSAEDAVLAETVNDRTSSSNDYNVVLPLMYRKMFMKPGRSIVVDVTTGFSSGNGDQDILFSQLTSVSDSAGHMNNTSATDGQNIRAGIYYTMPFLKGGMTQVEYAVSYEKNDAENYTFTLDGVSDDRSTDSLLTNVYGNRNLVHDAKISWQKFIKGVQLTIGSKYQWRNLSGEQTLPAPVLIDKTYQSVLPEFMIGYHKPGRSINFQYNTDTRAPSLYELQDAIDYSNPSRVYSGNPALGQDYSHNIHLMFNKFNAEKASSLAATLQGRIVSNYIGNTSMLILADTVIRNGLILKQGTEIRYPVNLGTSSNLTSHLSYGFPLKPIKSNLNLSINANFRKLPGIINGVESNSNIISVGSGFHLSSNISENLDFSISSRVSYYSVDNNVQQQTSSDYWGGNVSVKLNLRFAKSLVLRTETANVLFTRFNTNPSLNYFLLNIHAGKKVFKSQLGEVRLSIMDALSNNRGIRYNATESYSEQINSVVIRRVVLLSFIYNLRQFK